MQTKAGMSCRISKMDFNHVLFPLGERHKHENGNSKIETGNWQWGGRNDGNGTKPECPVFSARSTPRLRSYSRLEKDENWKGGSCSACHSQESVSRRRTKNVCISRTKHFRDSSSVAAATD